MPSNRVVGDAGLVAERLASLAERTGADELMISTMTHGLAERIDTLAIAPTSGRATPTDHQGRPSSDRDAVERVDLIVTRRSGATFGAVG